MTDFAKMCNMHVALASKIAIDSWNKLIGVAK